MLATLHELLFALAEVVQHPIYGVLDAVANPRIHVESLDDVFLDDEMHYTTGCLVLEEVVRFNGTHSCASLTDSRH